MKHSILAVVLLLSFQGCASFKGKGTASCNFKPGIKYYYIDSWKQDPTAQCAFTLEVPLRRAAQAKDLAAAFAVMLNASPTPEGAQPMKVELKIQNPEIK